MKLGGDTVPGGQGRPIEILLVDDDPRVCLTIQEECALNGVAVTLACTIESARVLLRGHSKRFDVVILEVRLPDGSGESLFSSIDACPRQPAVIVCSSLVAELGRQTLEYRPLIVAKPVSAAALLRIAKTVADGYVGPSVKRFTRRLGLSRRETEAIVLISRGFNVKAVADRMCCSEKTVYAHLARAARKARCTDYHEVVGTLISFTCQAMGHTPPDHSAFLDRDWPLDETHDR